MAARPGTGPISAWSSQAGYAPQTTGPRPSFQPGSGAAPTRPAAGRPAGRAADWGERTERIDRVNADGYPERTERTERIDRVNADGYPEPRPNGRSPAAGRPAGPTGGRASDPFSAAAAPVSPGRGRVDAGRRDNGRPDSGRIDNGRMDTARSEGGRIDGPDWRTQDRREHGRDAHRDPSRTSGGWPAAGRGGLSGADRAGDRPGADDPLTSTAYSSASASDSDGRSYRVAARRSQAQAKLTEQTQVFSAPTGYPSDQHRTEGYESGLTGEYPTRQYDSAAPAAPGSARGGQYEAGAAGDYPSSQHRANSVSGVTGKSAADQYRTGEYPAGDYRTGEYQTGEYQTGEYGQYRPDPQPTAARYQGYSGSQPGLSGQPGSAVSSSQPARRGPQGPAGPGALGAPSGSNGFGGHSAGSSGRPSQPNAAGAPSGQYPAQQPRHRQPRPQPQLSPPQAPQSQAPRQPAQPQLPPSGGPGAAGAPGGSGQSGGGQGGAAPSRSLPAGAGRNPYESAVTGSYPYPGQPYPARSGPGGNRTSGGNPAVDGRDDRYYRPAPAQADGYNQGADGNDGYGAPRDRRY
ncbi:MAG TPA: hypothetical protein VII59_19375 [Streptosporangiaceae bacterium]